MFSTIKNTEIKSNAVLFQTVEKWGTKHKSFITRGYDLNRYLEIDPVILKEFAKWMYKEQLLHESI